MTDAIPSRNRYINLRYLPEDHPLRNTLLVEIDAEYKHSAWDEFRPVVAGGGKFEEGTYNTLSRGWHDFYEWRVPKKEAA